MMMRPQHNNNNKRGRGRNRGRHGGGSGGGGGHSGGHGGNPANRVYDSNGPDVKVRGTAQTVADKYMQLGRDAQSSGDGVMAESYYQHAEHYYRLWLANQPAGQPIHFPRRPGLEDEFEEDSAENAGDIGEGEELTADGQDVAEGEAQDAPQAEGGDHNFRQNRPRETRDGEAGREGNRGEGGRGEGGRGEGGRGEGGRGEGGRRDRFRSRWPRRNERDGNRDDAAQGSAPERGDAPVEAAERAPQPQASAPEPSSDNWEAPSFLTRPVPVPPPLREEPVEVEAAPAAPRRGRPRRVVEADLAPAGEGESE
jgi:hypothetical protein